MQQVKLIGRVPLMPPFPFDAAVSDGLFPTNASSNTCFLRGVWCIDTDGDGLEDGDELYVYLTDPHNPDTDGDGLTDGWEWWYWMNPCVWNDPNVDPDEDGLSNIEECQYGTDPFNDDSDSDGMPDPWEIAMGIDPSSRIGDNGHDADPNHDGLTNYEEYCRGMGRQGYAIIHAVNFIVMSFERC